MKASDVGSYGVMGCFAFFWSAMTLTVDVVLLIGIQKQLVTLNYNSTPGTITKSAVKSGTGSKGGRNYSLDIGYTYQVNRQIFAGTKYRFNEMASSDSWAKNYSSAHPVGTGVSVYYDAANPGEAVLVQGIEGVDLFVIAFMTPFNLVMLAFWYAGYSAIRGKVARRQFSDITITQEGSVTRARIIQTPAWVASACTIGALTFISIFVVGFLLGGFHPSLSVAVTMWVVILGIAGFVYLRAKVRERTGANDLLIDHASKAVSLPRSFTRRQHETVPAGAIYAVAVKPIPPPAASKAKARYGVVFNWEKAGETRTEQVAEWSERDKAEAFAIWLQSELRQGQAAEKRNVAMEQVLGS